MDGAALEVVRDALDTHDPLPGTGGFAGEVDGRLVRDVLGRYPLFSEQKDFTQWSTDWTDLDDPVRVPPGVARDENGDEEVWTLPDRPVSAPDDANDAVRDAVLTSVRDVDSENLAVAFSGGVDSGLVASGVPDAPLYVAGFEGSHDVAAATAAADAMGRELRVVELTHEALKQAVPELVSAIGRDNPMDIQIALPLYLTAEQVAADGYDRLAVGQGADELFGGYSKVVSPASDHRVDADTVRGATREVIATLPEQLERDVLALRAAGVEPVAPLLHDRVVDAALRLPAELLATEDERKIALRRAADGVLPDSVTSADKKAVQYGTYAARELDRLARQAGYKRRMDDHVGQYIRSLCEE